MRYFILWLSVLIFISYIYPLVVSAQSNPNNIISNELLTEITWEEWISDYMSDYSSVDEEDDEENQELFDELQELHSNPININNTNAEALSVLPFLSTQQIDALLLYVGRRRMYSLGELMLIKGIDYDTRIALGFFIYPGKSSKNSNNKIICNLDTIVNKRHFNTFSKSHDIIMTAQLPLYLREGYKRHTTEVLRKNPNKEYQGNALATNLRYRGNLHENLSIGITAKTDAGEPFNHCGNMMYDYYSGYVMGTTRGFLRTWIIGDYRLNIGQGLVAGNMFRSDASAIVSAYRDRNEGIEKHSSTDEYNFLRGAAVKMMFGRFSIYMAGSLRKLDATLDNNQISTIITTGLHRTSNEIDKKNNSEQRATVIAMKWKKVKYHIGLSSSFVNYDRDFSHGTAAYRRFYMDGNNFFNLGINYGYTSYNLSLTGEAAWSNRNAWATLNTARLKITHNLRTILMYRYYNYAYLSPLAKGYVSGSRLQNEQGALCGLIWSSSSSISLNANIDYAEHPYTTYYCRLSSSALKWKIEGEYNIANKIKLKLRYKGVNQSRDNSKKKPDNMSKHSLRLKTDYNISVLRCATICEGITSRQPDKDWQYGIAFSHRMVYKHNRSSVSFSATWFNTDTYQEAIYMYDSNLQYLYNQVPCYYHGLRGVIGINQCIGHNVEIGSKYSSTYYTNRNWIGTDLQRYDGNWLNELSFFLKVSF